MISKNLKRKWARFQGWSAPAELARGFVGRAPGERAECRNLARMGNSVDGVWDMVPFAEATVRRRHHRQHHQPRRHRTATNRCRSGWNLPDIETMVHGIRTRSSPLHSMV